MVSILKNVCEDDRDLLFQWVNDKQCRLNSFYSAAVSYEEHCEWFAEKMNDQMCHMFIYYADEKPTGQIRVDCKNGEGYISYSVANEYRGQGHGIHMLKLLESKVQNEVRRLIGLVKYDNMASQRIFHKNNYTEVREKDYIRYVKELNY